MCLIIGISRLRLLSDGIEGGYFGKAGQSNTLLVLLITKHDMNLYGGVDMKLHQFLN